MNQNYIILITIAVAIIVFLAAFFVCRWLQKKKVNPTQALEEANAGLTYAQSIASAISPFLPTIANNIIMIVLTRAQKAVAHSEATYKAAIATGQVAVDTRKAEATSLIKTALALEGIEETPEIDKLIDTVIPMLVMALPKTHETTVPQVTASATPCTSSTIV
ncbi:MAG TPA: hypothetical protein VHO94_03990 [Oscillospiraceae bacterium]|nr:hypothetical protein [Oscillospiraceae bacterium]